MVTVILGLAGNIELIAHNDECWRNQRRFPSETGFERPRHISTENCYIMTKQFTIETELKKGEHLSAVSSYL